MALEAITQLVETLVAHGAVDGATPDVLDALIEAWLSEWRAELVPRYTARRAGLQRLVGVAETRVASARQRATSTQLAYDSARAAYALAAAPSITSTSASAANTRVLPTSQETNGVRVHPLH